MGTTDNYKYKDGLRVCDICGVNYHKSELQRIGPLRWSCPDDAAGLTAEQIARHNANVRPLTVKAIKNPRPPTQVPTYQVTEADILNLVLKYAPQQVFLAESGDFGANLDSVTGLDQTRTAGWMAFYLGNLALENRRPTRWIQAATIKLLGLCDSMLSLQFGSPSALAGYQSSGATRTAYGAFYMPPPAAVIGSVTVSLDVPGAAVCLMALLRAFQLSGLTKYRDGARRTATFLRRAQCIGLYSLGGPGFHAQLDTSGAIFPPGPFPEAVSYDTGGVAVVDPSSWIMRPSGIVCAWALDLLRRIDGDSTYGDAGPVGDFAQRTDSTLSAAVSACTDWWSAGATDGAGASIVGFGPAAPRDQYIVASTSAGFANFWNQTVLTSANWALGVRALWEIGGYTGQAASNYAFLRGGVSNAANQIPATWGDGQIARSLRGTYDPSLCLAAILTSTGADFTGTGYDWRTVGLLAPIQSARDSGSLGAAKDTLSVRRKRSYRMRLRDGIGTPLNSKGIGSTVEAAQYFLDPDTRDDLRLLTQSGLSLQTSVGIKRSEWTGGLTNGHYIDLQGAVQCADAYRYFPGRFPLAQG